MDFHPPTIMVNHNPARVVLMFIGLLMFLAAITLNTLSGFGAESGEYLPQTLNRWKAWLSNILLVD